MDKHDAVVWKIDMPDIKKRLPDEYRKVLDDADSSVYTIDQLDRITGGNLEKYDNDMGASGMVILEPPSMDQRVAVFCKPFLQKVAELFCRKLRLHFTENCRPPLQTNSYFSSLPAGSYLGWIKLSMTSGFAVASQSLTS